MLKIRAISLLILCCNAGTALFGQQESLQQKEPWQEIASAFNKGDSRTLASYFNNLVDLGLPEKENSYSKSQGEIVMRDFFKKSPPDSFQIEQKGMISETSHYAICQYLTGEKKYQVSIYLRHDAGTFLITKIKFELQE